MLHQDEDSNLQSKIVAQSPSHAKLLHRREASRSTLTPSVQKTLMGTVGRFSARRSPISGCGSCGTGARSATPSIYISYYIVLYIYHRISIYISSHICIFIHHYILYIHCYFCMLVACRLENDQRRWSMGMMRRRGILI